MPLSPGLLAVPAERVFCLTMAPEKLQQLRRARAEEESIPLQPYASLDQFAPNCLSWPTCRKHHWQRIDATGKSVEEVAREIIGSLEEEITPLTGAAPEMP